MRRISLLHIFIDILSEKKSSRKCSEQPKLHEWTLFAFLRRPILMAIISSERHLFLRTVAFSGHLEMIQLPIQRENAATGARGELDPQLFQRCADAIFPELRMNLHLLDFMHGSQRGFHRRLVRPTRLVRKASELLFDPPIEDRMDRPSRRTQIASD
jgi:hypothetical protein